MPDNLTSLQRIHAFAALGGYMRTFPADLERLVHLASRHTAWFTPPYIEQAIKALANNLHTDSLQKWLQPYQEKLDRPTNKTVGLVLAGNIPLVGFHDILAVLIGGFNVQVKLSSDDKILIPHLLDHLITLEPRFQACISYVDRLQQFDAIIATGSNNTSRYFEYYFSKVPHIIRKNRNGVAVIHGTETQETLQQLGHDLFDYYGLGCRNVSKIYFPENYTFNAFFEGIAPFHEVINHHKYHNNYDYHKSIYLINGEQHLDNGFLLLKRDQRIASPLAVVYYETYSDLHLLKEQLNQRHEEIQCIVSDQPLETISPVFPLGKSQHPALDDYADGVNTLDFLMEQK